MKKKGAKNSYTVKKRLIFCVTALFCDLSIHYTGCTRWEQQHQLRPQTAPMKTDITLMKSDTA